MYIVTLYQICRLEILNRFPFPDSHEDSDICSPWNSSSAISATLSLSLPQMKFLTPFFCRLLFTFLFFLVSYYSYDLWALCFWVFFFLNFYFPFPYEIMIRVQLFTASDLGLVKKQSPKRRSKEASMELYAV